MLASKRLFNLCKITIFLAQIFIFQSQTQDMMVEKLLDGKHSSSSSSASSRCCGDKSSCDKSYSSSNPIWNSQSGSTVNLETIELIPLAGFYSFYLDQVGEFSKQSFFFSNPFIVPDTVSNNFAVIVTDCHCNHDQFELFVNGQPYPWLVEAAANIPIKTTIPRDSYFCEEGLESSPEYSDIPSECLVNTAYYSYYTLLTVQNTAPVVITLQLNGTRYNYARGYIYLAQAQGSELINIPICTVPLSCIPNTNYFFECLSFANCNLDIVV